MSDEDRVSALYQSLFSREAEPEGADYWVEQLSSGTMDLASIAFSMVEGAEEKDREALQQKVEELNTPDPEEPKPEPEPEETALSLSFPDAWSASGNTVSFKLAFPSEAELGSVSLQGGGSVSASASSSTVGGVTTAMYTITASNGSDAGILNLPFSFDESLGDNFAVTVSGLSINGQTQDDTTYVYQDGSLVEQEPEPESLTLGQALALETLPEHYTLAADQSVDAGELTVAEAQSTLNSVTTLINGAVNADDLDADGLFSWQVRDSAAAVLAAIESGVPSHVANAATVQVTDDEVSQAMLDALAELSNFEQGDVGISVPDTALSLSFLDAWDAGSNTVSFELTFPSEAELEGVSLQGGGSMSTSASSSTVGGVTTAVYTITASNGRDTGILNLPFSFVESPNDDFEVTVSGLSINGQAQADTTYAYQDGSLVEQEPELTPGADITPPELVSLDIPDEIELSENGRTPLTISAEADDDLSGVSDVKIWFDQDISSSFSEDGEVLYNNLWGIRDWEDGVEQSESTRWLLPTNGELELDVSSVEVSDRQGNEQVYEAEELIGMGVNTTIDIA